MDERCCNVMGFTIGRALCCPDRLSECLFEGVLCLVLAEAN